MRHSKKTKKQKRDHTFCPFPSSAHAPAPPRLPPQTMGRLFLETLSEGDAGAVYTCACGAEVASASALVWEVRRERIGDASPRVAHPSPGTIVSCQ